MRRVLLILLLPAILLLAIAVLRKIESIRYSKKI